ncbi:hypothetical protein SMICM304S_03398 [Streptomyces microflavus]
MGSARRCSTSTNATPRSTPPTAAPITSGEAPRPGASISAYVTPASASAPSTAPSTSNRPCAAGSRDSGTWRRATGTQIAASGRFSRNTHRQPGPSTSHPPTNGPTAAPTPPNPDQSPTARARSSGWKLAWMSARDPGVSSAPPTPCRARAAMRTPAFGAIPQRSEASANHTIPTTNTRRRPYRSPSAPPSRISPASVSMYALTVHWSAARSVSRSSPMRGRATLMTVESSIAIPEPSTVVRTTQRPTGEATRISPGRGGSSHGVSFPRFAPSRTRRTSSVGPTRQVRARTGQGPAHQAPPAIEEPGSPGAAPPGRPPTARPPPPAPAPPPPAPPSPEDTPRSGEQTPAPRKPHPP